VNEGYSADKLTILNIRIMWDSFSLCKTLIFEYANKVGINLNY
jgi:hypothetical protein